MKHFKDVVTAFEVANTYIPHWSLTLDDSDSSERVQERDRLIAVNANAYLALLIGQLEVEINRLCQELIRERRASSSWEQRRAWDILDAADDRIRNIPFLNRVALLTDKGGTVYKRAKQLYETRNKIAHGDLLTESLDVAEIAKDIERIAVSLKGVP
ncbi:hypothetical protein JHL17_18070 [Azospirillum sp. YIM B02556]|uniref:RiboL-PSP-HEPN domain-containing protein n=1 Tax=Azospirillum endophyticum TaxID=2800326 RepID=A0ABS1F7D2_9PROT|nr:hypothetical protein [Azospirillum endophyticum]MBK1839320.1 hypothetical protein [Azospirillum endophyticum]